MFITGLFLIMYLIESLHDWIAEMQKCDYDGGIKTTNSATQTQTHATSETSQPEQPPSK
jgi:hypothetical protein